MAFLPSYLNYCSKLKMLQSFCVQKHECSESREGYELRYLGTTNAAAAAMAAILTVTFANAKKRRMHEVWLQAELYRGFSSTRLACKQK
jgi:hypothetical protein